MPDNISTSSNKSACFLVTKYLAQSFFLFAIASLSSAAIIFEWGNLNLWTMLLVLSVAPMLNLPIHDLAVMWSEGFKSNQLPV